MLLVLVLLIIYIKSYEFFQNKTHDITLISVGTDAQKTKLWEDGAKKFGWDYKIIGKNMEWPRSKYGKAFGKFKFLIPAIETIDTKYLLVTDAYDVIVNGTPQEALKKYFEIDPSGTKIVIGEEITPFYINQYFFPNITNINNKNINTGHIMGRTSDIRFFFKSLELFKEKCTDKICSDQKLVQHMHNGGIMEIDKNILTDPNIFYVYYANNNPEIKFQNNRFHINGKTPIVIHCVASDIDNQSQYYYLNDLGFQHFHNTFYEKKCTTKCPICGNHWLYTMTTSPGKWSGQFKELIFSKISW